MQIGGFMLSAAGGFNTCWGKERDYCATSSGTVGAKVGKNRLSNILMQNKCLKKAAVR